MIQLKMGLVCMTTVHLKDLETDESSLQIGGLKVGIDEHYYIHIHSTYRIVL